MAVIRIQAQKDARCMQAVCQIHGDRRTQILRFDVNRFDGGVDLGGLRWVIKTTNALGVEDIFDPEAVEIKERTIAIDWLVDGSVTDASGITSYELNGIDTTDEGQPVQWSGGLGSVSVRTGKGPKFGETDGMTNIEKLVLYVEGELQSVIEAGDAAQAAADRANHAADILEDPAAAVDRANAAAQRAETAAETVGDLEAAVNRANAAAGAAVTARDGADMAAGSAYSAANRAEEAAKNVENIEEATIAAHEAAEAAHAAAATANEAALPHVQLYGVRVHGETAKASGNPVTFLPDADSLLMPVTVLEPKQEGGGDPYPAGGGKNLLPITAATQTVNGITFTVKNGVVTANGTASATAYLLLADAFVLPAGTYVVSGIPSDINYDTVGGFFDDNWKLNRYGVTTLSAAAEIKPYIRINSGQTVNNVVFRLQIEAGSTPTDFAPYSNIRPFIGYDKLGLNVVGKNLVGGWVQGAVNSKGEEFSSNTVIRSAIVKVSEKNVYVTVPDGLGYFLVEYTDDAFVARTDRSASQAFTLRDNTTRIRLCLVKNDGSNITPTDAVGYQVEYGSVGTGVVPYQNKLHTVQIGQTVYGGKFDWLTGKGLIEWVATNLSHESVWSSISTIGDFTRAILYESLTDAAEPEMALSANGLCSHAKYITDWAGEFTHVYAFDTSAVATFPTALVGTTSDSINAWIEGQETAGTPVQITYKLAKPVEIQLTPHIISAADPEQTNTLYGDGSIEVEYVKPLHVSIEERVAAALAAATE